MNKTREDYLRAMLRTALENGEDWAADVLSCGTDTEGDARVMFDALEERAGAEKAAQCIAEVYKFACTLPPEQARVFGKLPHGRPEHLDELGPLITGVMRILTNGPEPILHERDASEWTFDIVDALDVKPDPPPRDDGKYVFSSNAVRQFWRRKKENAS